MTIVNKFARSRVVWKQTGQLDKDCWMGVERKKKKEERKLQIEKTALAINNEQTQRRDTLNTPALVRTSTTIMTKGYRYYIAQEGTGRFTECNCV